MVDFFEFKLFSTIKHVLFNQLGKWRIKSYVGTDEISGQIQFELLKKEECDPTSKVLASRGKIVASIRLAEGNKFGSPGSIGKKDSMDKEWQYPGVSWFKLSTVKQMADKYNLMVEYKPEYTEYYVKNRPREFHDWLIFYKNSINT